MTTPSPRLVLASASPRRRRLLEWLGLPYECVTVEIDESLALEAGGEPEFLARDLAERKALEARKALAASAPEGAGSPDALILAFDTIVVADGRLLGKPADREDARSMLESLSGRTHEVVTGVAILCRGTARPESFTVTTPVRMRTVSEEMLDEWLAGDELLGCAGAYNIERHLASVELDQCFQNVAGLPLCHLFRALEAMPGGCVPSAPERPVPHCDAARRVRCQLGPRLLDSPGD